MLTDLQTKKLTRYFRVYDIDDDGGIESADFERIVENVRLLHGVDGDGPDELHEAYMALWDRLRSHADSDGEHVFPVVGRRALLPVVHHAMYLFIGDESTMNPGGYTGARWQIEHVTMAEQLLRSTRIEDSPGIHL